MKVLHTRFQEGQVISINEDNSMTINFNNFGIKKLVYGNLLIEGKLKIIDDTKLQKFYLKKSLKEEADRKKKTSLLIDKKYDERKINFKEFEPLHTSENTISNFTNQYKFLSNSFEKPIYFNQKIYNSISEIINSKDISNTNSFKLMMQAIEAKFINPELRYKLLETGSKYILFSNKEHDNYWGACKCKKCSKTEKQNKLGIILMRVRKNLLNNNR